MRTFASLLPADKPVTSTTALAVVMLDRAGVDADALRIGLTIIECPATVENDIADCIDALLFDDDAARGITWGDKNSPAMILVGHTEDREFRRALARGIPIVVVAPRDRLPEDSASRPTAGSTSSATFRTGRSRARSHSSPATA